MILNERDLREARNGLAGLNAALTSERVLAHVVNGLPPEVVEQVLRVMKTERAELSEVVEAYENAKDRGDHQLLQKRAANDPGLTLIVARISKGMSQRDLAWRLGIKEQQVQRYEADRYNNTSLKNCERIATLLGVSLRAEISDLKEIRGLDLVIDDVSKESIRKILKHGRENGWFSQDADKEELRRFIAENKIKFGSPTLLRTGLNIKDHSEDIILHAWRARVTSRAQSVIDVCKPHFAPLDLTWLPALTRESVFADGPKRAQNMLRDHGIILIPERQIPGLAIDGAAFLIDRIPIIGMTLRHDALDNFWFTLLHEVAHTILHYRTGLAIGFFDQADADSADAQEAEADAFASNILIPEERWRRSGARIARSSDVIEKFASEIGIHPAIVFGRIRKERRDYSIFSKKIGVNQVRNVLFEEK